MLQLMILNKLVILILNKMALARSYPYLNSITQLKCKVLTICLANKVLHIY